MILSVPVYRLIFKSVNFYINIYRYCSFFILCVGRYIIVESNYRSLSILRLVSVSEYVSILLIIDTDTSLKKAHILKRNISNLCISFCLVFLLFWFFPGFTFSGLFQPSLFTIFSISSFFRCTKSNLSLILSYSNPCRSLEIKIDNEIPYRILEGLIRFEACINHKLAYQIFKNI